MNNRIPQCGKKNHLLTFIDACWTFMTTKKKMGAHLNFGFCFSEVVTVEQDTFWAPFAGSWLSMTKTHN